LPIVHATWEAEVGGQQFEADLDKIVRSYLKPKQKHAKMDGGLAQVVEHLLSKCEDLSSNSSVKKEKKSKRRSGILQAMR
jgi:uncharacterized protein YwgA